MKRLETTIERGPFKFEQLWREGMWAIYRQTQKGSNWERFEVVHIRRRNARKIGEISIEAMETYPTSEDWGTYAWKTITLERAHKVVEEQDHRKHRKSAKDA